MIRLSFRVLLFLCFLQGLFAQNSISEASETWSGTAAVPLFPRAYTSEYLAARDNGEAAALFGAEPGTEQAAGQELSLLLNNDVLAFYGHPLSRNMGILGRYSKEKLDEMLTKLAVEYAAANGDRGVKKAFYLIYGTAWPKGEIGILKEAVIREYVEYALEHDMLVFLDHQIGRYDPVESLMKLLPWLRYPNVHLALDPEWRTNKPMEEIGSVSAEELNRAQQVMENYIVEHKLPGERMLVIHQFNWQMIGSREKVVSNLPHVRLVHCADGFGAPALKRQAYAFNAVAANMPIKGFKLFYNLGIPGAGYDAPLLTPKEVYALSPRPYLIMYQ
ncbi:MAG: hypothetical protein MdMp014T_0125 [Treponematales bacterium]